MEKKTEKPTTYKFSEALRFIGCKVWELRDIWWRDNRFLSRQITTGMTIRYDEKTVQEMKSLIMDKKQGGLERPQ